MYNIFNIFLSIFTTMTGIINMTELENILKNDIELNTLIQKVENTQKIDELKDNIQELKSYCFSKYCLKPYLSECEPEYCVYRLQDRCHYVHLVRHLSSEHRIDILRGTIN